MIQGNRQAQAGLQWSLLAFVALSSPVVVRAAEPVVQDRVSYLINTMLYAHDTDDREDAAEDLGKIGDPRAIPALEQAAAYDKKGGVRKEAYKALQKIRAMQPVVVAAPPATAAAAQPAPVAAPPPPPQPVAAPAPAYVAPPPVVVAPPPPPVYVAPAPVFVPAYYYPAPVVVGPPICRPAFGFGFGFSFRSYSHCRHR
jgi:hypothetical protein